MIGALDVLVVDDRPETVRFLTEFLLQRCRRVDVAASVKEATTVLTRRQAAGESYHLILSDFVMPGADGLALLRELRMRNVDIPFVFITGYKSLNPNLEAEAKKLGAVAILEKPIELREVERLLDQTTTTFRRKQEAKSGEQPFFGTSRVMRRSATPSLNEPAAPSDALERRAAAPPAAEALPMPPAAALEPRQPEALEPRAVRTPQPTSDLPAGMELGPAAPPAPVQPVSLSHQTGGYQRRPSQIVPMGPTTTSRIRRGVVAPPPPPLDQRSSGQLPLQSTPQPGTTFTARVRRSIESSGAIARGQHTESGRMITCTNCERSFLVVAKTEAYSTVCVHCGALQRITPA